MDSTRIWPSFELVSFLHPDNPPGSYPQAHWVVNDDLHLIHTVRGAGVTRMGGREYAMSQQEVLFIEPFVEYSVRPDEREGLEMFNFHFHLSLEHGLSIHRAQRLGPVFRPKRIRALQEDLRQWFGLWQGAAPLERARSVAGLHQLAVRYWREFGQASQTPSERDPEMERVAEGLSQKERLSYDARTCARAVYLSPSQVNRRFREAYGTSPKEYWMRRRYLRACSRLHYGSERISALARKLGFEDVNYFSRWFKTRSGLSPRAYRKGLGKSPAFPV